MFAVVVTLPPGGVTNARLNFNLGNNMRDKKEVPKYHSCGNVKYYYGKFASARKEENQCREITEVNCLSKIDLIKLTKGKK